MKLLIRLIFGLGVLIVLSIGVLVLTVANINPNDYKETIAEKVTQETGRDFKIDGNISLSFYPWLGLDVEGLTVGNAPGFGKEPFLQTKSIKARVKLMPLLRKELEMDTLVLHGATVNLAKNAQGVTNWDDLVKPKKEKQQGMPFAALVLGGIDIKDANIRWQDKQQGMEYNVTNAAISTGELKLGEPIDLKASMNVSASKPALSSVINFTGTVAYAEGGNILTLKPMLFEAKVKGKEIPGGEANVKLTSEINVDMDKEIAQINALDLSAFDTRILGQIEASNFISAKPEIKGELNVKAKDVPQLFKIAEIEPLASQLAGLSDKSLELMTTFDADLNRSDVDIKKLDLNVLGNAVNAEIYARNLESKTPAVKGKLKANGPNFPVLIKIAGQFMGKGKENIESLSKQLTSAPKPFAIETDFDVDLKAGTADIPALSVDALGMKTTGKLNGKQINSDSPSISGGLKTSGSDLPLLISIATQLSGDNKKDNTALLKQLSTAPKDFSIEANFDSDSGAIDVSKLSINALGMTTTGKLKARNIKSDSPSISGGLKTSGSDLPLLISIASRLTNDKKKDNSVLQQQLASAPKSFSVEADFGSDSGSVDITKLSIKALGMITTGNLKVKNLKSEAPAMSGMLKAKGPDLPLLMLIAASTQSKDSALSGLAKDLGKLKDKAFTVESQFDVDQKSGKFNLPALSFNAFDVQLDGNIKGNNNGAMNGKLVLSSKNPKSLLIALGQSDVADVLTSFNVNTGINGDASNINLKPLSLDAVFSGKNIPNSPVTLKVQADSNINLEKEIFNLNDLQVSGLGLDIKGNVKAEQYKTAPKFSGQLAVAPFNLRSFMQTLNKEAPKTADPEVFKRVAFSGDIAGSPGSLSLKNIKAELDESKLQGSMSVISVSPLNLEFGLGVDKLNADRYLPPQTKEKKTVATPESVAAGVATEIPVETLQAIKIKGDLAVGQFVISGAKLSDIEFSIRADKGDITLNPISAKLYEGTYAGDIHLDATGKEPKLIMNTKLVGVQTEPLLKDFKGSADVSGVANINLALNSSGSNTNVLKNRLSGKGDIKFTDGVLKTIDIPKVLKQIEIMVESKRIHSIDKEGETPFNSLTATMDIHNGVVDNKDMLMLAPGFQVKGEGMMANLNDETWKYNMTVKVDRSTATQGTENYNLGGYDLVIKCRGKIEDKSCIPDAESIIKALVGDTVKKEINKKLEDLGIKLPGSKQPAQQTQPAQEPTQQTEPAPEQQTQPKDPVKEIQDKVLKDIFDKVF